VALAEATMQLGQLQRQDRALSSERALLSEPSEIERIARQQYQLVAPGAQAYEVLPPVGSGATSNDPGFQPVADPDGTAEVTGGSAAGAGSAPTSVLSQRGASTAGTPSSRARAGAPAEGFFSRLVRTLEFWR
jgi:hypothetical protein